MGQDLRVLVPNEFDWLRPTSTDRTLPVTGLDKLVQIVTKSILTVPGRDIFALEYGAGLRASLPRSANTRTESGALGDVTIALSRAEEDIKRNQDTEDNKPDERLFSLSLQELKFDETASQWCVRIQVVSEAGDSSVTQVAL